jgi:hypothetical protein
LFRNKVGLEGVAAVVTGIWVLCFAAAAAASTAYPGAHVPFVFLAAAGLASIASGAVVARVFL